MIEEGVWHPPNRGVRAALDVLRLVGLTGWVADTVIDQLVRNGLMVREDYYVPSQEELFDLYSRIQYAYNDLPFRWVMCREVHDTLQHLYREKKYAMFSPILFRRTFDEDQVPYLPNIESAYVIAGGSLFDKPIRIDPAARTVMIELVKK